MSEVIKSLAIVVGVIAVLSMLSFLMQGNTVAAGYCIGVAAVCAILLADCFIQDTHDEYPEDDQ